MPHPDERFIPIVDLTADELLMLSDCIGLTECNTCLGSGFEVAVTLQSINHVVVKGLEPTDEICDCCFGSGFHYVVSLN